MQCAERDVRRAIHLPSRFSQRQAAVTPREQLGAQALFQRMDLPADGGLRQEQFLRCPGEAQVASRRLEAAEKIQRRKLGGFPSHACSSCEPFQKIVCSLYRTAENAIL